MLKFLSSLEEDGHTISPGYEYDAAKKDMVMRLGKEPERIFPHASHDAREVRKDSRLGWAFTIFGTPCRIRNFSPANASGLALRGRFPLTTSRAGKRRVT